MTHVAVLLLSQIGFAMLLLAMARHQQEWLCRKLSSSLSGMMRTGGMMMLVLGFLAAGIGLGWGYGTVAWCGSLSVAAMMTIIFNLHREKILARIRR
ncbi:DUF3325 domain-containing protein [Sphingobium lactosutens]|uniref:DUF3325 domain-containing protein n=1 Tax=Sphingobium lactosutens TaxID=522773 RepID=UPI0015BCC9BB|nr:DUF3325 domain-containing protein [Sphingobium lactosutens]NWK94382.1 DUF3325 domain-containing protein [Sphingobium lactosutens]